MKHFLLTWGLIFFSALFDSYAAFIVKSRFNELGHIDYSSTRSVINYLLSFFRSPLLITAMITFAAAPALSFFALNRMELSISYPIMVGFHVVFFFIFGTFFLGEGLNVNKIIGIVLVFLSLYFFYK